MRILYLYNNEESEKARIMMSGVPLTVTYNDDENHPPFLITEDGKFEGLSDLILAKELIGEQDEPVL